MVKLLNELTLLSKFLFGQTMDCPEAQQAVLQIILGNEDVKLLTPAQTEKENTVIPSGLTVRKIRIFC